MPPYLMESRQTQNEEMGSNQRLLRTGVPPTVHRSAEP